MGVRCVPAAAYADPSAAGQFDGELKTELDERAQLAAKYPDWHLWLSSGDRPWATRRGNIAPPLGSGYPKDPRWRMTIDADTWPELEKVLKQQTDLEIGMLLRLPLSHAGYLFPSHTR
jgi:hypothetical protein